MESPVDGVNWLLDQQLDRLQPTVESISATGQFLNAESDNKPVKGASKGK